MKKIFFKSLLALGAITIPLAGTAVALTSCTTQTNYATTDVAKYYTSFLNKNHGRWAGNSYNFSNVNSDDTGLTGTTLEAKYPLDTVINKTTANYGSHHAYLWLLNEITKNLRYTELNSGFSRPAYGTVSTTKAITAADGTTKYDVSTSSSVIYNSTTDHSLLYKTGVVTHPFLWNRGSSLNNIGSNLIVTINPDESVTSTTDPYDFFIVAHYDSTASGTNKASWGATDNATSVAMNLAILKYFSNEANRKNLKTRLHIMFADAEELGVLGTNAFVQQYLGTDSPLLASSWGMINLDTIAGGDYMYIHSPDTRESAGTTGNRTPALRNMINAISKSIANNLGSSDYELQIHPQYVSDEYQEGETGDWSDHYPFYKNANIPIAYVESTNFALKSKYDTFDGYSQTMNKYAWLTKDYVPVEMVAKTSDTGQTIYELPDGYKLSDFILKGDIWHSDIDTPDWLATYIGENKIFKQLDVTFQTLIKFLTSTTPHKIS